MQQSQMGSDADGEKEYIDELKAGTKLLQGQYTIDSFLNSGGFGITYLAKDSLDRRIVIKECFPGSFCRRSRAIVAARSRAHQNEFRSVVKLFMQEARSLAKLVHPNIVGVHQVFEDNETAYMAIDYVNGRDLLDMIEDPAVSFQPDEIVSLTKKLLSAVAFIHENDILHRDISPDNILIQQSDGEPILIDFGAAREQATKASRALSALRVVKDGYSPQEFYVAGSSQGPWSDLYALAASLYHLISDKAPINSQVRLAAVAEGRGDPYEPLAGHHDGYPEGFLEAIDKAMKTVPKQRTQDAQEWLDMFQNPGEAKVVPLKTEKAAAPKAATTKTNVAEAVKTEAAAAAKPDSAPQTEAQPKAAASKGKNNMVLRGTAAAVAIIAGIGYFVFTGGSDEVETVAEVPVLSKPAAPKETASTPAPAAKPAAPATVTARAPAPTPSPVRPVTGGANSTSSFSDIVSPQNAGNANRPVASRPSATRPTTTTARPSTTTNTRPAVTANTTSGTTSTRSNSSPSKSFADIIAAREANQPRQIAPRTNVAPRTVTPRATAPAAAPATSSTAARPSSSGSLSFADIISANPSTQPRTTAPRIASATPSAPLLKSSGWTVDLPFTTTATRRDGKVVQLITGTTSSTALALAGSWVEEGVEIIEVNGQPVSNTVSVVDMLSDGLIPGVNGNVRTPVTIKRVGAQSPSPATLTLTAMRAVSLSNGVEVESRLQAGKWQTRVTKVTSAGSGFQVGDILLREKSSGKTLTDARSMEQILGDLVTSRAASAQFDVQRGGLNTTATMPLN